jgi:hypothetical protein
VLLRESTPASARGKYVRGDRTGSLSGVEYFKSPCAMPLVLASLTAVITSGSVSASCRAQRHPARLLSARPLPRRAAEAERQPDLRGSTMMRPAVEKTKSISRQQLVGARWLKRVGLNVATALAASTS